MGTSERARPARDPGGLLASELALEEETSVDVHAFRLARFAEAGDSERRLHF